MLYIYLFLCLLMLVAGAILYFFTIRSSEIPANAQLVIDAWNSIQDA